MRLKGKVAVVTGAGQGIGRGIAEVFAREGADVVVNDLSLDARTEEVAGNIRRLGRRALAIQGDVSKRADLERIFDEAWQQLGPVDILVNNAGIETIVPFTDLTDQQWEDVVHVNLKGGWMAAQILCKRLIAEKRKGSIVNIGSIQAGRVLPGRTHYAPSKLAIEALTRNMSAEVGPHGIRVNCVHPGLIDTPMTSWVMNDPEILPHVVGQISLGRTGKPCDIGKAVAFLASDEADYITGQSLYVDGGWVGK
ncbi:MAG TPA: SDR family NAD(P)-dependent oxidoreductase [Acidobacteriaceae bacterium]|nr:SDR family NAD(P)-dependent oxidoreductase [Acidobacteriaceae bacterium]